MARFQVELALALETDHLHWARKPLWTHMRAAAELRARE